MKLQFIICALALAPLAAGVSAATPASPYVGQVRGAHLEAHLAQVEILTAEQNASYAHLRGYGGSSATSGHGGMQHKH